MYGRICTVLQSSRVQASEHLQLVLYIDCPNGCPPDWADLSEEPSSIVQLDAFLQERGQIFGTTAVLSTTLGATKPSCSDRKSGTLESAPA